jgi:hypothetical protein
MKTYIGTKIVQAEQMALGPFQRENGKEIIPHHKSENVSGYKVTYEDGYVSWSPKEVFERCYREITESEKKLIQ